MITWTRRQFSQTLAASAAAVLVTRRISAQQHSLKGFAFVGSGSSAGDGRVAVYRVAGSRWTKSHEVSAVAPAHLVMHPSMPVLYVVHRVDRWDDRRRGAVSAYRLHTASGELKSMGSQPLSLAAANPRHAVVTADGSSLFVAAESGGAYNVLPLAADGALLPVRSIRKEMGYGDGDDAKIARPMAAAMHPDGSILTADAGQETISRFHLQPAEGIELRHRTRVHAGVGPSQIMVTADGRHAYALAADGGAISVHDVNTTGLSATTQVHPGPGAADAIVLHPSGRYLLAAGKSGAAVLRRNAIDGRLSTHGTDSLAGLLSPQFSPDGGTLYARDAVSGRVLAVAFDAAAGTLGAPVTAVESDGAISLLVHLG